MKIIRLLAATFAVAFVLTASVFAAAKPEGTWAWSQPGRDAEIKVSLLIQTKAGQVTGAFTNPNQTVDVTDLVIKDDDISFSVVGGRRAATKYTGKISGDTITGTIEVPARGGGDPKKVDWKATRVPTPAK